MASFATKRVKAELKEFETSSKSNRENYSIEAVNNNIMNLNASLKGPPDTPYQGGRFFLNIEILDKYPFIAPKVKFITHIWHPNISSVTGTICLDILKENWEASMSIQSILISIQVLLQDPRPDNPQDAAVASQYINKRTEFNRTAAYWTAVYAKPTQEDRKQYEDYEEKLQLLKQKLKDSRYSEEKLISALSSQQWNVDKAHHSLV